MVLNIDGNVPAQHILSEKELQRIFSYIVFHFDDPGCSYQDFISDKVRDSYLVNIGMNQNDSMSDVQVAGSALWDLKWYVSHLLSEDMIKYINDNMQYNMLVSIPSDTYVADVVKSAVLDYIDLPRDVSLCLPQGRFPVVGGMRSLCVGDDWAVSSSNRVDHYSGMHYYLLENGSLTATYYYDYGCIGDLGTLFSVEVPWEYGLISPLAMSDDELYDSDGDSHGFSLSLLPGELDPDGLLEVFND